MEAAITVDDALAAADQAALFKVLTKSFFQKRGMIATFMAKWSMDYPGQSGHLHQSLVTTGGTRSVFFDDQDSSGMSDLMRHYVAGIQTHPATLLAMTAPTINSYTRLVKERGPQQLRPGASRIEQLRCGSLRGCKVTTRRVQNWRC